MIVQLSWLGKKQAKAGEKTTSTCLLIEKYWYAKNTQVSR